MSQKIKLLQRGLHVAPFLWALQTHPELWNQHKARTESLDSPHHGLDDIWARYGDLERANDGSPHDSFWYPAADLLGIKTLCYDLMRLVEGDELGGVLITRIPPGKECKPHTDTGWHARRYQKFGVQIASAPGQAFCFDDEQIETQPGDLFVFDNQFSHWIPNPTPYERVSMIVCIRTDFTWKE